MSPCRFHAVFPYLVRLEILKFWSVTQPIQTYYVNFAFSTPFPSTWLLGLFGLSNTAVFAHAGNQAHDHHDFRHAVHRKPDYGHVFLTSARDEEPTVRI